jgi:asparagine N-glycosylation enzyme membrane subunit Stt3
LVFSYYLPVYAPKDTVRLNSTFSYQVCVFLAPFFSSLTAIVTYLLTSELHSVGAGLCAAGMISIVPGYISR